MNRRKLVICIVKTIIISAIAILFVMPLIWMGLSALKTTNEVFAHPFKWLPAKPMWSNFKQVWCVENVNMMKSYGNSIIIVFFSTVGQIAIASLAAYAFAKIQFKGKNFVFMMFLASMMIPGQVTIIPRFMLFKSMGLYNTLWSCILPFWFSTTAIFMLRQFYIGLPNDLMEAAKIDGAGHFRIFLQVLMPLTKPAMITLVILAFIGSWNEYLSPLIFITKQEKYTVAQAIRWYLLDELQRYDLTMAAATIAIVPVIILFISCQKYFVEGIATSGVKG
ncbi:MAG TPA: sugar ABC transporter ATP-binding protein [Lachnospiraceae bacterium]|nr:carbohydrate ABC transporter permease [Clostridium sp.]HBN25057.1 sugar ABC transporter ATP-binding protein [Lachnospiraceae bacterium]HCK47780.1 sugar ABC transporter ATP-binding protein [Lachnospiraceae bacterium]